jgi:ABC-type nitrate/sulfonate/bicarbonate transport system substrate-binding protein
MEQFSGRTDGFDGRLGRPLSRRDLLRNGAGLAGGAALLGAFPSLLAACSSSKKAATAPSSGTAALTKASIQFDYLLNAQFMGSYYAETRGYYTAQGVDVTLLPGGPNISPEPIVVAGTATVAVSHTAEIIQAIDNGADLKIIGATFQKSPTCMASRADAPIMTPQDMVGKKIGISASNTPIWDSFLKANNMTAQGIDVVTVQFDASSLANGEIDGLMAFAVNEPIVLKLQGTPTYYFLLNDFNYPSMEDLYIARGADLLDPVKRKVVAGIMAGESKGWSDALADPDGAANLVLTNFGKDLNLSAEQQKLQCEGEGPFVSDADTAAHGLFWMTPDKVAGTIKSMALGGVAATPSLFTNEILTDIYKGGTTVA